MFCLLSLSLLHGLIKRHVEAGGYAYAFDTHAAFELEGKERIPQGARYDLVH